MSGANFCNQAAVLAMDEGIAKPQPSPVEFKKSHLQRVESIQEIQCDSAGARYLRSNAEYGGWPRAGEARQEGQDFLAGISELNDESR